MSDIMIPETEILDFHLKEVLAGRRRFENAGQAVWRMISDKGVDRIPKAGRTIYDFRVFREGKKHIIGWFDELNDLVNFIKDVAEGGSAKERAFVFVGEPGNGKTFVIDYICNQYRKFLAQPMNRRYSFNFINLDKLGKYGNIHVIQSQTFEDPMILAMNLFESKDDGMEYLAKLGFADQRLYQIETNYRPFGACTEYIWNDIRNYCDGDIEKMLEFARIVPVPLSSSSSIVTGKYSAGDKITASASDLVGEEDITRLLSLSADVNNPYKFNIRAGAIARVGGGGILFCDEIFKNKKDLINVFLQIIQPSGGETRHIELKGYKWPVDILVLASSNNEEYKRFVSEEGEGPIKDRCDVCHVAHNTDYILQQELTRYAIGTERKTTVTGEGLHEDPNLEYVLSVIVALTRIPHNDKLTPVETMKLEAGESGGDKSIKSLLEIKKVMNANQDVTKRWGQRGIGHRGLGRIIKRMLAIPETHEGECLFAGDAFGAAEREILDYVAEAVDRDKCMKDLKTARKLYREKIRISIFNAFREDKEAVKKDVLAYVNMVIALGSDKLGPDKTWRYIDPQTNEFKPLKIDERYVDSVEARLGNTTEERKETSRNSIRKIHGQKMMENPNYDFMDNENLVKAVTEVRLESDVAGAGSLIGALTNLTNDENVRLRNRMIDAMFNKLGYGPCAKKTCAQKTIEEYCKKDADS
jgi:serine protein kinase